MVHSLTALLSLTFVLVPAAFAASADDWKSRSIYQLVTDRFATSDGSSATCNSEDRKYCGGTYQGVINHLDYIQNMGFDAIWISPIVKNIEGETAKGEAYHGYWTEDINSLNDHFGSADDLKSLVTALHDRKMYLMLDVVVNHFVANPSSDSTSLPQSFDYSALKPFSDASDYHSECFISNYDNQTEVEDCWLGDTELPLLDVNTENTEIVSAFNDWVAKVVSDYDIDAIRIDTVKHVRKDFWPDFVKASGVFSIGEVLQGDPQYVKDYTEVMDNVLDYPSWYPLIRAFTNTSGSLSELASTYTTTQSAFKNGLFTAGSFLENHDQARFQSHTTDSGLVANAVAWPFVNDGIPILYYGQEQGYQGGEDPENREALWFSGYEQDKPLYTQVKALNAARKLAISKNRDFTSTASKFIDQPSDNVLALSKPPLLTLLTNAGSSGSAEWTIPSSAGLFTGGETVVDLMTCKTFTVDSSGELKTSANNGQPRVIIPTSQLDGSGCQTPDSASADGAFGVRASVGVMMSAVVGLTFLVL